MSLSYGLGHPICYHWVYPMQHIYQVSIMISPIQRFAVPRRKKKLRMVMILIYSPH